MAKLALGSADVNQLKCANETRSQSAPTVKIGNTHGGEVIRNGKTFQNVLE